MDPIVRGRILSIIGFVIGAGMILSATSMLSGGSLSAVPLLVAGIIIFIVAAPAYVYFRERIKNHNRFALSEMDKLKLIIKAHEQGDRHGKK